MGYFSQKKKQKRVNHFLALSLSIIAMLLFSGFFFSESSLSRWVDAYRFQIYALTVLLLIYALFYQKTVSIVVALGLLIFNYTLLSADANLFFNSQVKGNNTLNLSYHRGKTSFPDLVTAINEPSKRMGTIRLAPGYDAIFLTFNSDNRIFTLINLDFERINPRQATLAYENLSEFVGGRDEPVLIVGDFGVPAWSPVFKSFLRQTGLQVKNHILLTDGYKVFSPLAVPTINLLAYKNVGISKISYQHSQNGEPLLIKFDLNWK